MLYTVDPAQHPFVEFVILLGRPFRRSSLTLGDGRTAGGVQKANCICTFFHTQVHPRTSVVSMQATGRPLVRLTA